MVEEKKNAKPELPFWVIKRVEPNTGGVLPVDFSYIIDELSGQLFEPALLFMAARHVFEDGAYQKNTVDAYTSDILDWIRFCTRVGIPWNRATWADLSRYVSSMDRVSPHHSQRYREGTKTRRLVPITLLYKWAPANIPHLCTKSPYGTLFDPKRAAEFLDARRRKLRSKVPVGKDEVNDEELPNVMQSDEVKAVLKAIGPVPRTKDCDEDEAIAASSIGHLGMEIGLQAGLRVSEVVNLRVRLFRAYESVNIVPSAFYRIGKFRRKGGRMKFVRMHGELLQKIVNYMQRERACVMRGVKMDHGVLLVHKRGLHKGERLRTGALQRRFARACLAAELTRPISKMRPTNGDWSDPIVEVVQYPRYTFHDLRHTFAVWTYYSRKADGDAEPWKHIQEQLGHEHPATTMKIYLRVTQDFEAFITDVFIDTLYRDAGIYGSDEHEDEEEVV